MNHSDMTEFIVENATQPNPPSLLLRGPIAVGKSTIVLDAARRVAEQKKLRFRVFDEVESATDPYDPEKDFVFAKLPPEVEPTEVLGHPRDMGDHMGYKPYGWAYTFRKNGGCQGIIFADEALSARQDTIDAFMRLLLEKTSGFMQLREDIQIVAAGNYATDNPLVKPLPKHAAGRVQFLTLDLPSVKDWASYVSSRNEKWDVRCLAYLLRFEEDIYERVEGNELNEPFANPRSWERLAVQLAAPNGRMSNEERLTATVEGWVGKVVGQKFEAFLKYDIPEPERFLKQPELFAELKSGDSEHGLDKQFLAVASIGQHLVANFQNPLKAGKEMARFAGVVANEVAGADLLVTLLFCLPYKLNGKSYRIDVCTAMANADKKVAASIERILRSLPGR